MITQRKAWPLRRCSVLAQWLKMLQMASSAQPSSMCNRCAQALRPLIGVSGALIALSLAMPSTAAPAEETTPLVRAEKTLRELGGKAKDTASEITSYALSLIGVDYRFGGNTPEQGLDCSGLIRYVFQQATGLSLPRSAREQARVGESVSKDKLQPGDLVFFNTRRFQFSHVGLYIGENRFIHAPSAGGAVQVVSMDNAYWQKAFNGARRIVSSLPDISALLPTANAAAPKLVETEASGEPPQK
jgi:cell wall-associated NlpC family hydrolase